MFYICGTKPRIASIPFQIGIEKVGSSQPLWVGLVVNKGHDLVKGL